MSQRIFVTGVGIVTAVGLNTEENLQSLLGERSGIAPPYFLETIHREIPVGEVKLTDAELRISARVPGPGFTRTASLGLLAVREAIESAHLSDPEITKCAFISATSTGGVRMLEKYFYELQNDPSEGPWNEFRDTANPGEHAERIAESIGIREYIGTVSTACSSSANALLLGSQMIRHGKVQRAICGGSEALSRFTLNGFNSLFILDKSLCKPFDDNRRGLNLGEGAAYLVLESENACAARGGEPLAELLGFGNANDAFHQTASSPDGAGAWRAMNEAINDAGISPAAIDYINAHGTATENNDLSEGLAIQRLFGDRIPPFSSTKAYTGHTLAAAGSVEAVFSILALRHGNLFSNLNFHTPMKELSIVPVTKVAQGKVIRRVLSNSFGFGGNTSSLVLGAVEQ